MQISDWKIKCKLKSMKTDFTLSMKSEVVTVKVKPNEILIKSLTFYQNLINFTSSKVKRGKVKKRRERALKYPKIPEPFQSSVNVIRRRGKLTVVI